MKKLLLFSALVACSLTLMAQKRYYKTTVEFQTTDGCYRSATNVNYFDNKYSANFDGTLNTVAKWVRPYKIKRGTFKITEMARISKSEFISRSKPEKFKPCEPYKPIDLTGLITSTTTTASCDTCHFRYIANSFNWRPMKYNFFDFGYNKEIMSVSMPDSTGIYTVKFSRDKVKFINDTTFTFKIQK